MYNVIERQNLLKGISLDGDLSGIDNLVNNISTPSNITVETIKTEPIQSQVNETPTIQVINSNVPQSNITTIPSKTISEPIKTSVKSFLNSITDKQKNKIIAGLGITTIVLIIVLILK